MRTLKILITTGDPDGIGLEVTAKALREIGPRRDTRFFILRDNSKIMTRVSPAFKVRRETDLLRALQHKTLKPDELFEIRQTSAPALWVESAAQACLDHEAQALVTAPLSKTSIRDAGLKDIGHTEILARLADMPIQNLFMGFLGEKFNVVLATGHRSLKEAVTNFSPPQLKRALKAADELRKILPKKQAARPVALVGLNPHAGEEGMIGREEKWIRSVQARFAPGSAGPLVPDAAFLPGNWAKYSVYVCPYHDQGLIPFKLVHGFAGGVHLTLGLPFVRTSVDHGTAKDLFGLNKAQSGSMREALLAAIQFAKERTL